MSGCNTCSETCYCAVEEGPGITITGSGQPADPWVISGEAVPTALVAADTPTVDSTVTGTGVAVDPFVVSSVVVVSPDVDNCLEGRPNGLYAPCATDTATVVQAGDTPCIDVTVTEAPANTFTVSAVPVIAPEPNGLECGPTGLTVPPSADAGNTLTIGTDGRLLVPPSAGVDVNVVALDTNCMNTTVTEAPANTFTVSVDPIVAPEPNGLECGATGLTVPPSADAGNTLTIGTDGRLLVPPAVAAITAGCGIEQPVPGTIQANVQPWPYPCDLTTLAGGVYCDPATGELRGEPLDLHDAQNTTASTGNVTANITPGNTRCQTTTQTIDLTNACEPVRIFYNVVTFHSATIPAGTNWRSLITVVIDGGAPANANIQQQLNDTGQTTQDRRTAFSGTAFTFAPGLVHTVQVTFCVENLEPGGGNTITSQRVDVSLNMSYTTLNQA